MRSATKLVLLALLLAATQAGAQTLPCGADGNGDGTGDLCATTRYGMGHPNDFAFRYPPDRLDTSVWNQNTFSGSYFFIRSDPARPGQGHCGGTSRAFGPVVGQVLLREFIGCTPTSQGPDGVNPPGQDGGCRVEIPQDLPAPQGLSQVQLQTITVVPGFVAIGSSRPHIFGTAPAVDSGSGQPCLSVNRWPPSLGTRYITPVARGGDGTVAGGTYIRWDDNPDTSLRQIRNGASCCQGVTPTICPNLGVSPALQNYPALTRDTCLDTDQTFHLRRTNDWMFDGGAGTPWITDPEHVLPGQTRGVCETSRFVGCDIVTAGGNPCPGLGQTTDLGPLLPGGQARIVDGCDLREVGIRTSLPADTGPPNYLPIVTECGVSPQVLRGTPNANCALLLPYQSEGDPGSNCNVINFSHRHVPDLNCDGVVDPNYTDLCPLHNEWDYFKNSDLAIGGDTVAGVLRIRGDECECGDQTVDGIVNVADLVGINDAIFNPVRAEPICDANNDLLCNVSDIVAANREIFVHNRSTCRHVTLLSCGDAIVDPGEQCDDGNLANGDGCDTACLLE